VTSTSKSPSTNAADRTPRATILAGVPNINMTLYHRIRFRAGDPAAVITDASGRSTLIIRDIEMHRARQLVKVDRVCCPADFPPPGGLSGDRPTATAQATAEFLRREGIRELWTDRTLPMIFAHHIREVGVQLHYDPELGVRERRSKDAQEVEWLRDAQRTTEQCIEMVCRLIARAPAAKSGILMHEGEPLTAERVRTILDIWLMQRGYINVPAIIACGREGGDCHNDGRGPLYTEQPIIVDVFPRNATTLYVGDCTRTMVHGKPGNIPEPVRAMHAAVKEAKVRAIAAMRAGTTGEAVHKVVIACMKEKGYPVGFPGHDVPPTYSGMPHGTGHGLGLDLKEPPLLDLGGPELVVGDAVTVEPGLYSPVIGGVRIEDMVIVREGGVDNLNTLHEELSWD